MIFDDILNELYVYSKYCFFWYQYNETKDDVMKTIVLNYFTCKMDDLYLPVSMRPYIMKLELFL